MEPNYIGDYSSRCDRGEGGSNRDGSTRDASKAICADEPEQVRGD